MLPRTCAICDIKIKSTTKTPEGEVIKHRLCIQHEREYKNQLSEPWLVGLIELTEHQYNLARRDQRANVESLEKLKGRI